MLVLQRFPMRGGRLGPALVQVLVPTLLCAASACNSSKKDDAPATTPLSADAVSVVAPAPASPPLPLLGTWRSPGCTASTGGGSQKILAVFQDATVIYAVSLYSDSNCATLVSTDTKQGSFTIGSTNAGAAGTTNIDLLYVQETVTYPDAATAIKGAQSYATGSKALCATATTPIITGEVVDLTPCYKDPAQLVDHTEYAIATTSAATSLTIGSAAALNKD